MFLTRKAIRKTIIISSIMFVYSGVFLILSLVSMCFGIDSFLEIIFCVVCFILGFLFRIAIGYSEGKGKLIKKGNKLIMYKLQPAEFIKIYQEARCCTENVVSKPDFDVLNLLATAYDALNDTESELAVIEDMLAIATEKQKPFAYLLKSSVLFSIGKTEEAEQLFNKTQNAKLNLKSKMLADAVYKSDRAVAYGDIDMAENYFKQILLNSNAKYPPLLLLYAHFGLAEIYYKTDRFEEAKKHYCYCADNGGETAIKTDAVNKIKGLC